MTTKIRLTSEISIGTIIHALSLIGVIVGLWVTAEKRIAIVEIKQEFMQKKIDAIHERQVRMVDILERMQPTKIGGGTVR